MSFFSLARLVRNSFWSTLTIDVIRSRPSALRPHKRLQSLSRQCLSFWGMQYEHEIDEWIQYLVSAMSPFSDANPIFAVKWSRVVRTFDSTSPSKSHFAWETTHCGPMAPRFDYFRVFLVDQLQLEPSLSMRQIFVIHGALQNHGQDTKDYHAWIW